MPAEEENARQAWENARQTQKKVTQKWNNYSEKVYLEMKQLLWEVKVTYLESALEDFFTVLKF